MTMTMAPAPYHSYQRPTAEEVWQLYQARRAAQGIELQQVREVQALMNNELAVPLPELTENERNMVANLASRGMKQMSARIASVDPVMDWPILRPSIQGSVEDALTRKRIAMSWHYENDSRILRTQRGMRLLSYASAPTVIKPYKHPRTGKELPRWFNRHPLHTFPSECEFNDYLPDDVIFTQRHTYGWLRSKYPDQCGRIKKPHNFHNDPDADNSEITFDVLEYIDAYYSCLILIAPDSAQEGHALYGSGSYGTNAEVLEEYDNFACWPLCVIPGSISVDRRQGEYDGIIGMYQAQSALMALSVVAQRRSVFQREWAVSNPQEQVQVITIPDPASGRPGEIRGGRIEPQQLDPSFHADQIQDRLEANMRQDAGLPSEFGAMSQSDNVRTGRRGAQVMGAAINFTIAQAQDIFAKSMRHENEVAIAIDKAYWNFERKKYFVMTEGWKGEVTYTPSELWKHTEHICKYPINGVDADQLPVVAGQRIAMHTMSRRRFMEIDPMIPDADAEQQQIYIESVIVAFMSSIQALGADPNSPSWQPEHFSMFVKRLRAGMDPFEAFDQIQEEMQERQATMAPPGAPETMPGMNAPGAGTEQPTSIPGQERSQTNLTQLLKGLGTVQSATARAGR